MRVGAASLRSPRPEEYKHQVIRYGAISAESDTNQSTPSSVIMMDVIRIEDIELDSTNISPGDVERLRSLLPQDLQQSGNLSQLEIIIEAIHYIKLLQNELGS